MEPLKGQEMWVFAFWYWSYICIAVSEYLICTWCYKKVLNWGRSFLIPWVLFGFFSIQIIVSNLVSYSSFILQPQSRKLSNGCSRIGSLPIQGFFQISQVSIVYFFPFIVLLSRFCVGKEFSKNIMVSIFMHLYLLICWLMSSAVPTLCLNTKHGNRWTVWGCLLL